MSEDQFKVPDRGSWASVFPWLPGRARSRFAWLDQAIEASSWSELKKRLGGIGQWAMAEESSTPLGNLFSSVPSAMPLSEITMSSRLERAVASLGASQFSDVAGRSAEDLANLRQVGDVSVIEFCSALAFIQVRSVQDADLADDARPGALSEAFPFLVGVPLRVPTETHPSPNASGAEIAVVAAVALDAFRGTPLGTLFPKVKLPLRELLRDLPPRFGALADEKGFSSTDDMLKLSAAAFGEFAAVGEGKLDKLICRLAEESVRVSRAGDAGTDGAEASAGADPNGAELPVWQQAREQLTALARWRFFCGHGDLGLACAPEEEVREVAEGLQALQVVDFIPEEDRSSLSPVGFIEEAIANLLERRCLAWAHMANGGKQVELAKTLGVARQRVSQLYKAAQTGLRIAFESRLEGRALVRGIREMSSPVASKAAVLSRWPQLADMVQTTGRTALDELAAIFKDIEVNDTWIACPSLSKATSETERAVGAHSTSHGAVGLLDLQETRLHSLGEGLEQWMSSNDYRRYGNHFIPERASINDFAVAVLSIEGEPMGLDGLQAAFGRQRSAASYRNALNTDERIMLAGKARWALREWGLAEYSTLEQSMIEAIDAAGGQLSLDKLTEQMTALNLARNSVAIYSSQPPFKEDGGVVRVVDYDYRPYVEPKDVPYLYRADSGWRYRICVNEDHLRGSGGAVPRGLALALGVSLGNTRTFATEDVSVTVSCGRDITISSLRAICLELRCEVGDHILLDFETEGDLRFDRVTGGASTRLEAALQMVGLGLQDSVEASGEALCSALGAAHGAGLADLAMVCRGRGEVDLAELLDLADDPEAQTVSERLRATLDLLDRL